MEQIVGLPRQRGVGMVEILVSLLVLAIGILGFAGLQLRALSSTGDSHYRSQAMAIAQDLMERVTANGLARPYYTDSANWPATAVITGQLPQTCVGSGQDCTVTQIAAWDIEQIAWQSGHLLPEGLSLMRPCEGSNHFCMIVSWNNQDPDDCEGGNGVVSGLECVVLEVIL